MIAEYLLLLASVLSVEETRDRVFLVNPVNSRIRFLCAMRDVPHRRYHVLYWNNTSGVLEEYVAVPMNCGWMWPHFRELP